MGSFSLGKLWFQNISNIYSLEDCELKLLFLQEGCEIALQQ